MEFREHFLQQTSKTTPQLTFWKQKKKKKKKKKKTRIFLHKFLFVLWSVDITVLEWPHSEHCDLSHRQVTSTHDSRILCLLESTRAVLETVNTNLHYLDEILDRSKGD